MYSRRRRDKAILGPNELGISCGHSLLFFKSKMKLESDCVCSEQFDSDLGLPDAFECRCVDEYIWVDKGDCKYRLRRGFYKSSNDLVTLPVRKLEGLNRINFDAEDKFMRGYKT